MTQRATVSEMAMVVHWERPLERSAQTAFDLRERWKAEYPRVEILPKVALDASTTFEMMSTPEPRWIFASEDEVFALQFQDTMFGVNWRKRTEIGQEPSIVYPGFDAMLELMTAEYSRFTSTLTELGHEAPALQTATLFYDNMWLLPDNVSPISDVFAFWKTLGIEKPVLGPEVKFTALFDARGDQPARVDVSSSLGLILKQGAGHRAARIQLNGIIPLAGYPDSWEAVAELHQHITDIYLRVTTEATRNG